MCRCLRRHFFLRERFILCSLPNQIILPWSEGVEAMKNDSDKPKHTYESCGSCNAAHKRGRLCDIFGRYEISLSLDPKVMTQDCFRR